MIRVYKITASSLFQLMCSVSQLVIIAYRPNFHMVSQIKSCTIAWPPWLYIYFYFIFIGSLTPVPTTYAQTTNAEQLGFYYC